MTPYTHEPSWFAALMYISGGGSGYIVREEAPEQEAAEYCYCDTGVEISELVPLVVGGGLLIVSRGKEVSTPEGFTRLESSDLGDRRFQVFKRGTLSEVPAAIEVVVWRNGGGIGDVVHAAAVAEEYGRQGFSVVLMTMKSVRHVFEFGGGTKWVPIPKLEDEVLFRFMDFWSKRVRLWVNLDWSIEGFLLKKEITSEYHWGYEQRKAVCGKGYARNVADLAGLEEVARIEVRGELPESEVPQRPFVFIQLSGSGDVHKWSPHIDKLCVRILAQSGMGIYISHTNQNVGLAKSIRKYVEANLGKSERLIFSPMKRTFCTNVEIAKRAVAVLGPETGMMVAVSHEAVRKVLLVSHSAPSNFDDWVNTKFLVAGVACQPCHRMHSDFRYCVRDEATGASACMAGIGAAEMFDAILDGGTGA